MVHRGGGPGEVRVRRGARLEPLRHPVRRGQQLVRPQGLQQFGRGHEGADVRPRPFVGAGDVEVGAHLAYVHGAVRRRVDAVDEGQRPGGVRLGGDGGDVGPGAEDVARGGDGDQPGALVEQRVVLLDEQLAGDGVRLGPPDLRPGAGRGLRPGPDVGVVVEAGEHDPVAGPPGVGQGLREAVHQRRGVRPEHHSPGLAAHEVGHRGAGLGEDRRGAVTGGRRPAHVPDPVPVGGGDGLGHGRRHLGAGGSVEIGVSGAQGRIHGTNDCCVITHGDHPVP